MKYQPFSLRHGEAAYDFDLSIPRKVRTRIWHFVSDHNEVFHYQPNPHDSWTEQKLITQDVFEELPKFYGEEQLTALNKNNEEIEVDELKPFLLGTYPPRLLDILEIFYSKLIDHEGDLAGFEEDINSVFKSEKIPWLMIDGRFFKFDSDFFDQLVISESRNLIKAQGFEGALEEFDEARDELSRCEIQKAIHTANKSFESVLKSILGKTTGTAGKLFREFSDEYMQDIPEDIRKALRSKIVQMLPDLRNKLGGHGQGEESIEVPKNYGELAVNFMGAFNRFTIKQYLNHKQDQQNTIESETDKSNDGPEDISDDVDLKGTEDDIPF